MSVIVQEYTLPFVFAPDLVELVNNPIAGCDQLDMEEYFLHNVLGLGGVEAMVENDSITGVTLRQYNTFDPTTGITARFMAAMARLQDFLFGTALIDPGML